jgi:uncharacterized protein YndB with AHSA1/START domain
MSTTAKVYAERNVTFKRVLKAPRALVWKAWTDPAMLKQWWGPEQFTASVVEGDIKVGGILHITMRGPAGTPYDVDLPMTKRYREIVPGKKLVFENEPLGPDSTRVIEGRTTVTFADHPDGTLMELTGSAKAIAALSVSWLDGMEAGWSQSLDKLQRLVES